MGQPAAKENDLAVGIDIHVVLVPSPGGPVPTPLPHPFSGPLDTNLSPDVKIEGLAAATKGSIATNRPPHVPTPPGTSFQTPPANQGPVSNPPLTGLSCSCLTIPLVGSNFGRASLETARVQQRMGHPRISEPACCVTQNGSRDHVRERNMVAELVSLAGAIGFRQASLSAEGPAAVCSP